MNPTKQQAFDKRKFFLDAKKPGISIKGDIAPAYQVRRYGWSVKVPLSVVTDFEVESEREQLQRAINHAERRIDELVYELYGLTEEEVAIVEGRGTSGH